MGRTQIDLGFTSRESDESRTDIRLYIMYTNKMLAVARIYLEYIFLQNVHEILRITCTKNESTKGTFMLNIYAKKILITARNIIRCVD